MVIGRAEVEPELLEGIVVALGIIAAFETLVDMDAGAELMPDMGPLAAEDEAAGAVLAWAMVPDAGIGIFDWLEAEGGAVLMGFAELDIGVDAGIDAAADDGAWDIGGGAWAAMLRGRSVPSLSRSFPMLSRSLASTVREDAHCRYQKGIAVKDYQSLSQEVKYIGHLPEGYVAGWD